VAWPDTKAISAEMIDNEPVRYMPMSRLISATVNQDRNTILIDIAISVAVTFPALAAPFEAMVQV